MAETKPKRPQYCDGSALNPSASQRVQREPKSPTTNSHPDQGPTLGAANKPFMKPQNAGRIQKNIERKEMVGETGFEPALTCPISARISCVFMRIE